MASPASLLPFLPQQPQEDRLRPALTQHAASLPAREDRRREAQGKEETQPRSPRGVRPLLQTFALLSNPGDKVQSLNKPLWEAIRERLICSERPSPRQ